MRCFPDTVIWRACESLWFPCSGVVTWHGTSASHIKRVTVSYVARQHDAVCGYCERCVCALWFSGANAVICCAHHCHTCSPWEWRGASFTVSCRQSHNVPWAVIINWLSCSCEWPQMPLWCNMHHDMRSTSHGGSLSCVTLFHECVFMSFCSWSCVAFNRHSFPHRKIRFLQNCNST